MERSRGSRGRSWWWKAGTVLAALVFVFFLSQGSRNYLRDLFVNFFAPHASTTDEYASLSRDVLVQRLKDSESTLSRVRYQALLYGLLSDENAKLRQAAKFVGTTASVTARVVTRPPQTHYDTLLIDAGTSAGIQENNLVVFEGVLLGKIVSPTSQSATVQLFSSPGSERDVIVGNPSTVAIARGLGGGAFELAVPQGVKVLPGDAVRVSATNPMLLAVVTSVSSEAKDASQTVRCASPVSFADLDFIHIILN